MKLGKFLFILALFLPFLFLGTVVFGKTTYETRDTSEKTFLKSGGKTLLAEKRYQEALAKIEEMLSNHPQDPYLIKMAGFLSMKLGNRPDAEKNLKEALRLNPMDRQARLFLADLYMEAENKEEATEQLRFVIENPDDIGYFEDKAQRTLAVIEGKREAAPVKAEKNWKVFGTYGFEYDDNVALQSTVPGFKTFADRNAERFSIRNGLSYDYLKNQNGKLGVSYTFSQSFHTDSLRRFNFRNHQIQHYGTYATDLFGHPVTAGLRYTFVHGTLDRDTFSSSNGFLPWFAIEVIDHVVLSVYDHIAAIDFRDQGFFPDVSSRDGWYNTLGTMTTFYFSNQTRSVSLGYEFGYNQTEGDNFDAKIEAVRASVKSPVVEKISGEASFSVLQDDRYNYAVLPRRTDVHFSVTAKLIRPITKYVDARLLYHFTKVDNDHAGVLGQFEYSRHIFGGEISFVY